MKLFKIFNLVALCFLLVGTASADLLTVTPSGDVTMDNSGVFTIKTSVGLTTPSLTGPTYPTYSSTSTATGNINIDGVSYSDYNFSNGSSTATYTPVITAAPGAGNVRFVLLTVGGGSGVCTMTWTNITWMGTAGAAATTTNKKSTYACKIPSSGNALCSIVAEAY